MLRGEDIDNRGPREPSQAWSGGTVAGRPWTARHVTWRPRDERGTQWWGAVEAFRLVVKRVTIQVLRGEENMSLIATAASRESRHKPGAAAPWPAGLIPLATRRIGNETSVESNGG